MKKVIDNDSELITLSNEHIKELMKEKHGSGKNGRFKNEDLAEIIGCHEKTVSNYLHGKKVTMSTAKRLAGFFGVRVEYIIGADDFKTNDDIEDYYELKENERFDLFIKLLSSYGYSLTFLTDKVIIKKPFPDKLNPVFKQFYEFEVTITELEYAISQLSRSLNGLIDIFLSDLLKR